MKIEHLDTARRVFIVAEIGNNHEGSFAVAQEMIGRAAEAGADAVKFQTIIPERLVCADDKDRLTRLRRFQFSYEQYQELSRQAKEAGVIFFSTPFDLQSANFLNNIQSVFKIASGDNNFFPLIETVASFGKPMIVSTGLADIALIDRLYADIRKIWLKGGLSPGLAFLHCVSAYPVPQEQANLRAIATLKARFPDAVIGYSDHTLGIDVALYAVAAGARIIEKHFTLDKNYSDFRDHQLSADPEELRCMVDSIRKMETIMGSGEKTSQACEEELRNSVRRSIAAAIPIPRGKTLQHDDLTWLRPGSGLPPGEESRLIGQTLRRSLLHGELIALNDIS